MKLKKKKKKKVFECQTWPKDRGLDLRPNLVSIKGEQIVERKRRREAKQKGMDFFCMDSMIFGMELYGYLDFI